MSVTKTAQRGLGRTLLRLSISGRAPRLNCCGEAFEEMRKRFGGIDAATELGKRKHRNRRGSIHVYGLDRGEGTQFNLGDFHRVQNPRLLTGDYFDLVREI